MNSIPELQSISTQVRRDIIRMVTNAKSGHPGGSMSSADFLTALYFDVMKHDPATWTRSGKDQDVFILSAGHLTPIYYSLLARTGYFPVSELATFRQFGSRLQGHPSIAKGLPGVFQPSGSLGQGLSLAAGIAVAKKMDAETNKVYVMMGDGECEEGQIWEAAMFAAHHKLDNKDYKVYTILGDGEIEEGQVWEAAMFAAHNKLNNLIAITDWNGQQIDGKVDEVGGVGDLEAKFKAFGWDVIVADGHDFEEILKAYAKADEACGNGKPVMILFKSDMGHGVDFMAGTHAWHGKAPSAEQCANALAQLEETLGDF